MKFSIRDMLLLTMIVALILGWWLDHWRHASEDSVQHARQAQITADLLAAELNANGYDVRVSRDGTVEGSGPFKSSVTLDGLRYAAESLPNASSPGQNSPGIMSP